MDGERDTGGGGRRRQGAERRRRERPPLDDAALRELALSYVARFATSRAKLRTYLTRKLRERGWSGDTAPDLPALADRMSELGFIDDRAFAQGRASGLTRRGFGARRVAQSLQAAGIEEEDRRDALDSVRDVAVEAALAFAARRRFGPYATEPADPDRRRRAFGAMIRAGHNPLLSRRIVEAEPGAELDLE